MDNALNEILMALKNDIKESDGFCCFEILEPYINANRDIEVSELKISELLVDLVKEKKISAFDRIEIKEKNKWCPSVEVNIWNAKNKWYRISSYETKTKDI